MSEKVNTVAGPVNFQDLGKTLMHEHFVFGYPGYNGDVTFGPYNRENAFETGVNVANRVMEHGVKTVVDATTNETGRDPEVLKMISEKTGLNIICATGYYFEAEGAPAYFKFRSLLGDTETEIFEMFMKEINDGIGGTGIKPGVIKLASSKDEITDYEAKFFRAAAKAQQETGIAIITHTSEGTMGPEQADLLLAEGADPKKIAIGHMCGNTDIAYHEKTMEKGVYVALDRIGIQGMVGAPMDTERVTLISEMLKKGYTNQIMLSHDTVNFWLGRPLVLPEPVMQILANWHPTHLFENIIPELLKAGATEEQLDTILIDNPAKMFSGA